MPGSRGFEFQFSMSRLCTVRLRIASGSGIMDDCILVDSSDFFNDDVLVSGSVLMKGSVFIDGGTFVNGGVLM